MEMWWLPRRGCQQCLTICTRAGQEKEEGEKKRGKTTWAAVWDERYACGNPDRGLPWRLLKRRREGFQGPFRGGRECYWAGPMTRGVKEAKTGSSGALYSTVMEVRDYSDISLHRGVDQLLSTGLPPPGSERASSVLTCCVDHHRQTYLLSTYTRRTQPRREVKVKKKPLPAHRERPGSSSSARARDRPSCSIFVSAKADLLLEDLARLESRPQPRSAYEVGRKPQHESLPAINFTMGLPLRPPFPLKRGWCFRNSKGRTGTPHKNASLLPCRRVPHCTQQSAKNTFRPSIHPSSFVVRHPGTTVVLFHDAPRWRAGTYPDGRGHS